MCLKGKTKMQRERGETQKKEFDELMGQKQIKIRHTLQRQKYANR